MKLFVKNHKKLFVAIILMLPANAVAQSNFSAIEMAKKIADAVIAKTNFALTETEQKPVLSLQVVDLKRAANIFKTLPVFAHAEIMTKRDTILRFGISSTSPVKIIVNKNIQFTSSGKRPFRFKEIAYSIFTFQDTMSVFLRAGRNLIQVIPAQKDSVPVVLIRECVEGDQSPQTTFSGLDFTGDGSPWCYSTSHEDNGVTLPVRYTKKLAKNNGPAYHGDPYTEWNYPNGILMMSMMNLSRATGDSVYDTFVARYCDFILKNLPLFQKQYFEQYDLRGSNHRMFRCSMLDDAGSPLLPFVEVALEHSIHTYDTIIGQKENYILHGQPRLIDGTFCRPEPEPWTVWADDLFMSAPLLMRLGALRHDTKYYDEAARQVILFQDRLYDAQTKIMKHGWFSRTSRQSEVSWGRANGWMFWASAEVLTMLPHDHPLYAKIAERMKNFAEGLAALQSPDGMWHQVLTDTSSYEETSCTAMFIIGFSKGMKTGVLDTTYRERMLKAWNTLQQKIDRNGEVTDICCGTELGSNNDFYKARTRSLSDPRGLGAIITAAIEIGSLPQAITKIK
jgi:rhamnogalacturonyl hydrolase YesR